MLDDLAEVFVFDVLLATKARRRVCTWAACVMTLAAYVSSGFWMAPDRAAPPVPFAPVARAALPSVQGVEVAAAVVLKRGVGPRDQVFLRTLLDRHQIELDTVLRACEGGAPAVGAYVDLVGTPRASDLAVMLAARAIALRERGCHFSAVADLVALLRLTSALARPRAGLDALAPHAVAGMLENVAVREICAELRTRDLTHTEHYLIGRALSERAPLTYGAALQLKDELDRDIAWLSHWAATNELPEAFRGLRFYLPVRAKSRRAVADAVIARLVTTTQDEARRLVTGQPLPLPPATHVQVLGGWAFYLSEGAGWTDRLSTLWSNDRCVDLVVRLLHCWRPAHLTEYERTCQVRELEVAVLRDRCLTGAYSY